MPDGYRKRRRLLPALPQDILWDSSWRRKAESYAEVRRAAITGELEPKRSDDPLENELNKLAFMQKAQAPQQAQQRQVEAVKEAAGPSIFRRVMGTLEKAALPFEAFSEGINALVGFVVPQEAFRERSARSRQVLAQMLRGEISPAEAAGELRETHRTRSMMEQLVTGFLFDPLNVIVPGGAALKAGIRGGTTAALRAGTRTGLEWTFPIVGGKVAKRAGLAPKAVGIGPAAGGLGPGQPLRNYIEMYQRPVAPITEAPVRTSERAVKLAGWLRRRKPEGGKHATYGVADALEILTMKGATSKGAFKLQHQRNQRLVEAIQNTGETREAISVIDGWKWLDEHAMDVTMVKGNVCVERYPVKLRPGAVDTPLAHKLAKDMSGVEWHDMEEVLQNTTALFDGQYGVPLSELDDIYDWAAMPPSVRDAVLARRMWPQLGVDLAEQRAGFNFEQYLGKTPHPEYSPQMIASKGASLRGILRQTPGTDPDWIISKTLHSPGASLRSQEIHFHPLDSAAYFVADVQRVALDFEMGVALKEQGLLDSIGRFQDADKAASILKRARTQMIEKGVIALTKQEQNVLGRLWKPGGAAAAEAAGPPPAAGKVFYHGASKGAAANIRAEGFRPGSFLAETPSRAVGKGPREEVLEVILQPDARLLSQDSAEWVALKAGDPTTLYERISAAGYAGVWEQRAEERILHIISPDAFTVRPAAPVVTGVAPLAKAEQNFLKDTMLVTAGKLADDIFKSKESALQAGEALELFAKKAKDALVSANELKGMSDTIPLLRDLKMMIANPEEATAVAKMWRELSTNWDKLAKMGYETTTVLRMMKAGIDWSPMFIHGLVFAMLHPFKWAKATGKMFEAFMNPAVYGEFIRSRPKSVRQFRQYGGMIGVAEPVEAASAMVRFFKQDPFQIAGRSVGKGLAGITNRFEAAFTTWQDVARITLWEGLEHMAGGDATRLAELAGHINKMTGVFNPQLAGWPMVQRYWEGLALSFAPMYRRAAFGLLVDVFRGVPGKTTRLDVQRAQLALGKVLMVGGLFGYMLKETGLNEDVFDATTPRFMSFPVGGHWVGIGSAYYSLIRTVAALSEQAADPERRGKLPEIWNVRDNALAKWWRSQAPPLPSAGIDFVLGQTYIGKPLREREGGAFNPAALRNWGLMQVTPILMEALAQELRSPGDSAILTEGFGMRTFPDSLIRRRTKLANNLVAMSTDPEIRAWRERREKEDRPVFHSAMPIALKNKLREQHPELQDLYEQVDEDRLKRGWGLPLKRTEYFKEIDRRHKMIGERIDGISNAFSKGAIDARRFRDELGVLQAANMIMAIDQANKPEYAEVIEHLDEVREDRALDEDAFWGDKFYDIWTEQVERNPLQITEDGIFLPEVREELDLAFRLKFGQRAVDYIDRRIKQRREVPTLVDEFYDARDALRPYWNLQDTLWTRHSEDWDLISRLRTLPDTDVDWFRREYPRVRLLERRLDRVKERFRRANPELDWLLVKWYGYAPRTRFAQEQDAMWREEQARRGLA